MKLVFGALLFLTAVVAVQAEEFTIFQDRVYEYNEFLEGLTNQDYAIRYNDETNVFYLNTRDFMGAHWIHLTEDDLEVVRSALARFLSWNETAMENEVTLQREIPDSRIDTQVSWRWADEWYSARNLSVSFSFFSQSKERHQLVIYTNKVASRSNSFISFELKGLYFDAHHVKALQGGISVSAIEAAIADRAAEQSRVDELFD